MRKKCFLLTALLLATWPLAHAKAVCLRSQTQDADAMGKLWSKEVQSLLDLHRKNGTLPISKRLSGDGIDKENLWWSSVVPHDFKIITGRVNYVVTDNGIGPVNVFVIPSIRFDRSLILGGIGSSFTNYYGKADCVIQASNGQRWLAERNIGGSLEYTFVDPKRVKLLRQKFGTNAH